MKKYDIYDWRMIHSMNFNGAIEEWNYSICFKEDLRFFNNKLFNYLFFNYYKDISKLNINDGITLHYDVFNELYGVKDFTIVITDLDIHNEKYYINGYVLELLTQL